MYTVLNQQMRRNMGDRRGYKREYQGSYVPQKTGERRTVWKRFEMYLLFVSVLLTVNMFLMLRVQSQIRNMNKSLNQVLTTLAVTSSIL